MYRIYETYGVAFSPRDQRISFGSIAASKTYSFEQLSVGDAGSGKDSVVSFDQIIHG
jgi:hypothetical protein